MSVIHRTESAVGVSVVFSDESQYVGGYRLVSFNAYRESRIVTRKVHKTKQCKLPKLSLAKLSTTSPNKPVSQLIDYIRIS